MAVEHCDLVIRNGAVIDGTGAPRFDADVAVAAGRIVAVGDVTGTTAAAEIDAAGHIVAPGFIDVHTHDDNAMLTGPDMAPKVSQGVTTVVAGNCGVSLAPLSPGVQPPPPMDLLGPAGCYRFDSFASYMSELAANPPALNAACLVGHSTLRVGAMEALDRPATAREIDVMRDLIGEALDAGALGLSTGLFYAPSAAAPTAEVIALAEVLAPAGGLYTTHMRDEGDDVIESIEEALKIGRDAGVAVVISHHKVTGKRNFGRTRETLALIEKAQRSQKVSLDVYPYIASSTVLLPSRRDTAERVVITWSKSMPEFAGRDLADVAAALGCSKNEAATRLQPAGAIYFSMDEDDVQRVLRFPRTMVGSDGLPYDERPHPRLWGAFPRVLGHYSRELGLFGLEEAVHRMTGLTAGEIGLSGRGVIAPGAAADIVVFDAATVIDRATFDAPTEPAAGIETVIVNGEIVWRDGAATGARPGRVLRRQELQAAV
jgi:N-acyl-D-amino-acid deacylase